MVYKLNIGVLENGRDLARENSEPGVRTRADGDPEQTYWSDFVSETVKSGRMHKVETGETINCNDNNYYYQSIEQPGNYWGYYAKKISNESDVKKIMDAKNDVYRVKRLDRPFGEGLKNSVAGFFTKPDAAPAATGEATPAPTTGGRRSRNQRKSRRSRKQRNQRKSRRSRQ